MTAAKKYNIDQLMNIVLAPVVSEKSTFVADRNRQYVFRVADDATKPADQGGDRAHVQDQGRRRDGAERAAARSARFGRMTGRRRNWKKAYVRLAEGQEINFAATE